MWKPYGVNHDQLQSQDATLYTVMAMTAILKHSNTQIYYDQTNAVFVRVSRLMIQKGETGKVASWNGLLLKDISADCNNSPEKQTRLSGQTVPTVSHLYSSGHNEQKFWHNLHSFIFF